MSAMRPAEASTTLVELLVGLVLLALLGVGMAALMEALVRAQTAGEAAQGEARLAELGLLLEEHIARALPLPRGEGRAIRGDGRRLELITAPLPARVERGLRAVRLVLEPAGRGMRLLWCEAPYKPDGDPLAPLARAPCRPLARLPAPARWRYLLPPAEGGAGPPRRRDRITPEDPWPLAVVLEPQGEGVPWLWPLRIRALAVCAGKTCG